jgi:hypothetical protein
MMMMKKKNEKKTRKTVHQRISENFKSLSDQRSDDANLDGPALCRRALETCANDPAVKEACRIAALNRNNPTHLARLLIALASACFVKRTGGRPKRWSSFGLYRLMARYLKERKNNPNATEKEIHFSLAKRYGMNPETIRRVLLHAANPDKNLLLRDLLKIEERIATAPLKHGRQLLPDWRTLPNRFKEGLNSSRK